MASEAECPTGQTAERTAAIPGVDIDALKSCIMAGIDSKLSQKEETMWRRGLKEIKRLQSDQQDVTEQVRTMQEKQDALIVENQQLREALCSVTTKFEKVVNEMRQALRHLPQRGSHQEMSPSPSVASTAASDAANQDFGGLLRATELAQGRMHVEMLERALQRFGQLPDTFEEVWTKLFSIKDKARLVSELNAVIENRLDVSGKVDDKSEKCRTLIAQYEEALQKLQKAALVVLDTQIPKPTQDESFTEPTPGSSKANTSMALLTPSWPTNPEDAAEALCTPPRQTSLASEEQALLSDGCWPAWHSQFQPSPSFSGIANASSASAPMAGSPAASGSPAVQLSLANALTTASTGYPSPTAAASPTAATQTGGLQLQLADLVDQAPAPLGATPPAPGLAGVSPQYSTPLKCTVQVKLQKEPGFETLGMDVKEDGPVIHVINIDDYGLVGRHNRAQTHDSCKVKAGDLIVDVNGVSGSPGEMLQECKRKSVLVLGISRLGSPAASSVPSPLGANAPNGAAFSGLDSTGSRVCSDNGELDRVLQEVATVPSSWGRLRPEARVFVPGAQATEDQLNGADSQAIKTADSTLAALGTSGTTPAAEESEDGVARTLFS